MGYENTRRGEHLNRVCFKIIFTIFIIISIFILYVIIVYITGFRDKIDYIPVTETQKHDLIVKIQDELSTIEYKDLNKSEIKEKVFNLFKPTFYIEQNIDGKLPLHPENIGQTWATIRLIQIRADLNGYQYCYVLAHEYTHLTSMIFDESLTDFITIKTLYESGDEYLRRVALNEVLRKVFCDKGNDYDCTYQLIEYFNKN